jgi:peroxiredoxin
MPAFELPDANGETFHSTDLQGKVVVVRFWATW